MSEPVLQVIEPIRPPLRPVDDTPAWAKISVAPDDVCLVITASAQHPGAALAWPARPSRTGHIAKLWDRKEFPAEFQPLVQRCLEGEEQHYEAQFDIPQAGPRWFEINLYPGQAQATVLIRDITERKRTEAAVAQSEEHYRDLFHQAYQMQENLRRMTDRVLKIQEHERTRISRDLHDEVGQALTAINMNLAILRNSLVATAPDVERRISDTQGLIEQTMDTIHNFSRELRPAMLDDLGLLPALRNYVKIFSERTSIVVKLDPTAVELIEQLDSERKTVIYRIVQEGLNNVAKHAHAKRVDVTLRGSRNDVYLEVSDDGQGFILGAKPDSAPKQLGLLGLAERARLVGGEFVVASIPNRGTILRATIPFKSL